MHKPIVFDVETGPAPIDQVQQYMPEFTAPSNYKDPEKIRASVEEQRAKWLADGALSAITGRVLVAGFLQDEQFELLEGPEPEILKGAFLRLTGALNQAQPVVGFCCRTFDVPFLIRRAWGNHVPVPRGMFQGRYLSDGITDIAERWACGIRDPRDRISLNNLSRFLGVGEKNGDGANFSTLYASDRPLALEYLKNDLRLTLRVYESMGF